MPNALTMIKPHVVSRDLRGYSVLFYGEPKTGKTTAASKFPGSLIFAFEKGYSALPGVMVMPINSWRDFRQYLKLLAEEETKEMFQTIIIDTADIAYDYCNEYICKQEGVDTIGDIEYGKGYGLVEREFDSALRRILQLDYGLVLISHSTERVEKNEKGEEYSKIEPTLEKRARKICERTCDIIGMSRSVVDSDGNNVTKLFCRGTQRFVAGSRFKHMPPVIDFSYDNLVNAIGEAIEKEAAEHGGKLVTDTRTNNYNTRPASFGDMKEECGEIIGRLMEENIENRTKISAVVTKHLGPTKKFNDTTETDADKVWEILKELRAM
jgi:hypothetical protein